MFGTSNQEHYSSLNELLRTLLQVTGNQLKLVLKNKED